jgi:hypothetical protein
VVRDDHALKLLSRLLVVLMTAALLVGGTVSLAATDGGAAVAKKKCKKKRAAAAKRKKCKKKRHATPVTPPAATPPVTPPPPPPSASLSISPTDFDFGTVNIGESSSPHTFTVTNAGPDSSGSLTTSLGGTDPAFYSTSSDTCDGSTLPSGSSCTLDVNCQSVGVSQGTKTATLTVGGSPGGLPEATLSCFLTT